MHARLARIGTLLLVAATLARTVPARADDRVDELAKMLASSSSDKARLSAGAALAKLGDRRALPALEHAAKHDTEPTVVAAALAAAATLGTRP